MVKWIGIEDMAETPTRVWLSRRKDIDEWKPLRKADCIALNDSPGDLPIDIEYGRATADREFGTIRYKFIHVPQQSMTSATWFIRNENPRDSSRFLLTPMDEVEAIAVEDLYQNAVQAASTMGKGMDEILKEQIPLQGDYHVAVQKDSEGYHVLRKCPNTWFGSKSYDLQRGYGAYTVEGEEEEAMLGPVRHLIFVVHGIGEAMFSREDVTFTGSLIEDITQFRLTMQKRQIAEWKKECEVAEKNNWSQPPPPDRVEVIPIEWYDRIHSSSSALMQSLKAVTLTTIPALRELANDVIFDVLMYLTPNFCFEVLECVTDQIISFHEIFKKTHPEFEPNNGKFSLMGHSLGSVICWDLLSLLQERKQLENSQGQAEHGVQISHDGYSSDIGYQQYASAEGAQQAKNGSWGPSLPKPLDRVLPFEPDHTVLLGSPVGLYLTLRGAHAVFDELRDNLPNGPDKPKVSPFTLPTGSLHNIFHPSDPVAYRIEPLLLAPGTAPLPPPEYLTRKGEDVRLHVKAKQLSQKFEKYVAEKKSSLTSFMNVISDQAQTMLSQLDERKELEDADKIEEQEPLEEKYLRFPLAGKSTDRLDYQLQPRVIDSEYVSAVLAHSSYWVNTDVIDYTIDVTRIKPETKQEELAALGVTKSPNGVLLL